MLQSDIISGMIGQQVISLDKIAQSMVQHYREERKNLIEKEETYRNKLVTVEAEYRRLLTNPPENKTRSQITVSYVGKKERIEANLDKLQLELTENSKTIEQFQNLDTSSFEQSLCPICAQLYREIAVQPNGHVFCTDCLNELIHPTQYTYNCPVTGQIIHKNSLMISPNPAHPETKNRQYINQDEVNKWGTKLSAVVEYLEQMPNGEKAILFSRWNRMLQLVTQALTDHQIGYVYAKGNVYQMSRAISTFRHDPDCRVILLSSENDNSGNNLTEANHILLLDTANHPERRSVEHQAIGRAVRLGQQKEVKVIRFRIKDTVED